MIALRKITQDEFTVFSEYFIDDYSKEISENYGHSITKACELAEQSLQESFPNGVDNSTHDLLCIVLVINVIPTVVGYLWHKVDLSKKSTFIYDFYIAEKYRGKGLGKQAIIKLESQLQSLHISQIQLRVAFHNKRAFKLYKEIGFAITRYNMSKLINN